MGTQWTVTRSIRWRMRDWASCFLACRFLLDEDPSSAPHIPTRKMNPPKNEGSKGNKTNHKIQSRNRQKKDRARILETEAISTQNGSEEESSWPPFKDDEYIVFCFRDDGAINVVKESKTESSSERHDFSTTSSRPRRRKGSYSESAETIIETYNENMSHEEGNEICLKNAVEIIPAKGAWTESASFENRKRFQIEDISSCRPAVSVESSDSNKSDGSAGSFSFPVLGLEWIGSPVQMPRSESFHFQKHKGRCVRFQCCRF